MAAQSKVGICNAALGHVGVHAITDIDDSTQGARVCKAHYESARLETLVLHPWNCAIKRRKLAQSADTPEFGRAYKYPLPTDCLRVLTATTDSSQARNDQFSYEVEQGALMTDESVVYISYIFDNEDEGSFSVEFAEALAYTLAEKISVNLGVDNGVRQRIARERAYKLQLYRGVDSQEASTGHETENAWIDARR